MEEFLDAVTGGAIWGIGFGVAIAAVQAAAGGIRPVAKNTMRGGIALGDWMRDVTSEARENLQDIYHEAQTEVHAGREHEETASPA